MLSKLISACPEEYFEVIFLKKPYHNISSDFEKKVMVFSKLIPTCPKEHFEQFFYKNSNLHNLFEGFEKKIGLMFSKLISACLEEHFEVIF